MKKNLMLIFLILFQINLFAQKYSVNFYTMNAIEQALTEYHQQKYVGYQKHMVVTMKIMKINETSGKFVFSYILTGYIYDDLQPTHYVYANNELVLIIVDNKCKTDPEMYGINKITKEIKKDALNILAGKDLMILSQDPPNMVFKYKGGEVKGKLYSSYPPPKKYWF